MTAFEPLPNEERLALWGGFECTVNRVGDTYYDQFALSGHDERIEDLDRAASLGVRTLRYPVLWERVCPDGELANAQWAWSDARFERLRSLGITPIVGLLHHGSGPANTSLLDPDFGEKLARYARAVAERYPDTAWWSPVNEPLTTARFSGLYGLWYPHGRDEQTFARVLVNQVKAVVLAMKAIREVIPHARLVQTEDLGRAESRPALAYQARFENERRWATFDLLTGRIAERGQRFGGHLLWAGISEAELRFFRDNPCPPDLIGVDYYVTSDRFLDERVHHYPPHTVGRNHRGAYADVEAVRVLGGGIEGAGARLWEAWERYGLPVALTEAHIGAPVSEQIRWLRFVWEGAEAARRRGANVRAVTLWAMLGAYDWDSLLTQHRGSYESGVWDVGDGFPRETELGAAARALASGERPAHPAWDTPGWWERESRLCYPPVCRRSLSPARREAPRRTAASVGVSGYARP